MNNEKHNEQFDNSIKRMDIDEFRRLGYLQELNRRFLHPLGLALEVAINDDGSEYLHGIWDYRDDPDGIIYDLKNADNKRVEKFRKNAQYITNEWNSRAQIREKSLGFVIEPIDK